MKCILMNKNTKIALLEYNKKYNAIEKVYEIYNIEVENKTRNSIILDLLEKTDNMYLEDEENLHYYAYNHEMVKEELRVKGE